MSGISNSLEQRRFLCVSSSRHESLALMLQLDPFWYSVVSGAPLDPHSGEVAQFQAALRALFADAIAASPLPIGNRPAEVVFAIDGVLGPPEESVLSAALSSSVLAGARPEYVDKEMIRVFANEQPGESLVNVHAGGATYVLACPFQEEHGRRMPIREGGYGVFSGTDGGKYFLGAQVIEALLAARDHAADTAFTDRIRAMRGWTDRDDPLRWVRSASHGGALWRGLAELAECVVLLSNDDVAEATHLLSVAANHTAHRAARIIARAFGSATEISIGLSGSLLRSSSYYQRTLVNQLTDLLPQALMMPRLFTVHSIVGCARLVVEREHLDAWDNVSNVLRRESRLVVSYEPGSTYT